MNERLELRPFIYATDDQSNFWIEECSLKTILRKASTPLYVTSLNAFEQRVRTYRAALSRHFPSSRVYYALKANWGEPLIQSVVALGEGFDIVSQGELRHLLRQGVRPESICYAGVGKTPAEIREALEVGVGILNVEHLHELHMALEIMLEMPSQTRIAVRLNPCLDVATHPHLRTGALDSKFGLLAEQILNYVREAREFLSQPAAGPQKRPLRSALSGLHVHVGSQLHERTLFAEIVGAVTSLARELLGEDILISHLDFGGGLGVGPEGVCHKGLDIQRHVDGLAQALLAKVESEPRLAEVWGPDLSACEICLEPGRSIVASSTIFVSQVLYTKVNGPKHRFAYTDAGMNDFPRPSLYGAQHAVCVALRNQHPTDQPSSPHIHGSLLCPEVEGGPGLQIVGPVCESGDVLSRDPEIPTSIRRGDHLVFFESGAYCRSMASTYNLRTLPSTLFVRGQTLIL